MKKFIYKLVGFIAVCCILAFALDIVITQGLHRYTEYSTEVWNDLRDPSFDHDVLVLGSCQAMHDINPVLLDSILGCDSYILAMSNLTFSCHRFMWNMYKYYHSKMPKMIVLVLDYGDMTYREIQTSQENKQFLPLTDVAMARDFLVQEGGYQNYEIYTPLYRYYGHHQMIKDGIMAFFYCRNGDRTRIKGYEPMETDYVFNKDLYQKGTIVPVESESVEMLNNFMDECKQSDIKLVVAVPPLGDELADLIANTSDIYGTYDSIASKHACPIWCYTSCEFTQDTTYFESPMHLNARGADIYTMELGEWIKSLNVY